MTVRDIQKIQAIAIRLGYFYFPNTEGIGLIDRNAIFATREDALADYKAHVHTDGFGYVMQQFATPDMFPDFQRAYAAKVQTESSETYDWNRDYRVVLQFVKPGHTAAMIPADLVTPESLAELFS